MKKRGVKKVLEILNMKIIIGTLIFLFLSMSFVLAGDVIVKEGNINIENNLNSGEILFVNSTSGNVGIGISNPSVKLEVVGNVNITGNISAFENFITTANSISIGYLSGGVKGGLATGTFSTYVGYLTGYNNTKIGMLGFGSLAGYQNKGEYLLALGYQAGRGNTGNNVIAIGREAGFDNNFSNQFILKQANVNSVPLIQGNFSSGNVGIGTSSPSAKLDINGNVIIRTGGSAGKAICWKADGITLGYCSSAVGADGSCTCN